MLRLSVISDFLRVNLRLNEKTELTLVISS